MHHQKPYGHLELQVPEQSKGFYTKGLSLCGFVVVLCVRVCVCVREREREFGVVVVFCLFVFGVRGTSTEVCKAVYQV